MVGVDGHGPQTPLVGGAEDTDGDLAAVGHEQLADGAGGDGIAIRV